MPPGTSAYPAGLDTQDTLIRAKDGVQSTLSAAIDAVTGTIPLASAAIFPTTSVVVIEGEEIVYTGKSGNDLTGGIRGALSGDGGGAAAPHAAAVPVRLVAIAATHRVQNDAIIGLETKLGTGASTPAAGQFLKGTGAGASGWSALTSGEVTGALGFTPANKAGDTLIGALAIGDGAGDPASAGSIRLRNAATITARDQAGGSDINLARVDASDRVALANDAVTITTGGAVAGASFTATGLLTGSGAVLGTNPAAAGVVRLPNNQWISGRNAANTADVNALRVATDGYVEIGAASANIRFGGIAYGPNVSLVNEAAYPGSSAALSAIGITIVAGETIDPTISMRNAIDGGWRMASDGGVLKFDAMTGAGVYGSPSEAELTAAGNLSVVGTLAGTALIAGTTPASVGAVRIPNNQYLAARNAANTGDVNLIRANASDQVELGGSVNVLGGLTAAASSGVKRTDAFGAYLTVDALYDQGAAIFYYANSVFRWRHGRPPSSDNWRLSSGSYGSAIEVGYLDGIVKLPTLAGSGKRTVYSDASGNLTNSSSDERLKAGIRPVEDALAIALALRPVRYSWRDAARFGTQREIGFVAQQVRRAVPEVIGENADGMLSLDYGHLTAVAIGAIQELAARLAALEAQR